MARIRTRRKQPPPETDKHPDMEALQEASESSSSDSGHVSAITGQHSQSGKISKLENRAILKLRMLVSVVMVMMALGVGVAVYIFTRRAERKEFEKHFKAVSHELLAFSEREIQSVVHAASNLATSINVHMLDTGSNWPKVLMPHFELQGKNLLEMARIQQLTIVPLVENDFVMEWGEFAFENQDWIQQGLDTRHGNETVAAEQISNFIYCLDENLMMSQTGPRIDGKYAPVWQQYPAPADSAAINFDLFSDPVFEKIFTNLASAKSAVFSGMVNLDFLLRRKENVDPSARIDAFIMQPIYEDLTKQSSADLVGFIVGVISWEDIFRIVSHSESEEGPIHIVLHNTCDDVRTYETNGVKTTLRSVGDSHDKSFDHLKFSKDLTNFLVNTSRQEAEYCAYGASIFPTRKYLDRFVSAMPILYAVLAVLLFCFTSVVFGLYDFMMQRWQRDLIAKAERTNKLVSELFPRNVKDRLLSHEGYGENATLDGVSVDGTTTLGGGVVLPSSYHSKSRRKPVDHSGPYETKPIADLFPNATVMFADIVGFTAWSSVREPTQVFTLLETLYHSFDQIAKRRCVFKVETVGDCYVAVAGLPDPRPDHASVMARFARDCLKKMNELTKQLETTLGPDTGDLSIRIGLHSGPVTAGVLRGEKSRFQLFGDTVNTCARIETTGQSNRIHVSQETADLLKKANKGHWLSERADTVTPKGKGEMQTFWLDSDESKQKVSSKAEVSNESDHDSIRDDDESVCETDDELEKLGLKDMGIDSDDFDERTQSLVRWNADILLKLLKQIVARRVAISARLKEQGVEVEDKNDPVLWPKSGLQPIEEVQEIIHLPEFDSFVAKHEPDPETIEIDEEVVGQLNDFVRIIASMYRSNPFHNFEHASHVAMSVAKLLSRIVAPSDPGLGSSTHLPVDKTQKKQMKSTLHDHTYGITSDPLTQFACVLSALIHDVDHPGVPNAQLVKEKTYIARTYENQSVAEQNSIDTAWDLLMDVNFRALRKTICTNEEEQVRFRQLVVNSVMATDICDKELKALRNGRWEKAFSDTPNEETERDRINRKATIVIEHLIQASDIAHTMQHWHIYRKWNERLYQEMLFAYRKGRSDTDPSNNWYQGEIGFFDFYIIPLAKKLKDCGVFGVSCDEYLNYAQRNRALWIQKGQEIVANMVEQYRQDTDKKRASVKLDNIQDADGSALRSSLLSSETEHNTSVHRKNTERNILDLDADAMSIDTNTSYASFASFAQSVAKSHDGGRSLDGGRSIASSTDTIFEEDNEDDEGDDEGDDISTDDFYSDSHKSEDEYSDDRNGDDSGEDDTPSFAEAHFNGSEPSEHETIAVITTKSPSSRNLSKSKSTRKVINGLEHTAIPEYNNSKTHQVSSAESPEKAKNDIRDMTLEHSVVAKWKHERATGSVVSTTRTEKNKSQRTQMSSGFKARARSDTTTCSTTQANTDSDWDQESVESRYREQRAHLENMDLYCLQQRINSRLVGSIKNTRAYDTKPSVEDMNFF